MQVVLEGEGILEDRGVINNFLRVEEEGVHMT